MFDNAFRRGGGLAPDRDDSIDDHGYRPTLAELVSDDRQPNDACSACGRLDVPHEESVGYLCDPCHAASPHVVAIPLTKGLVCLVDALDVPGLQGLVWSATESRPGLFYARCGSTLVYMHRFLLGATGSVEVDHRNGNTLDNRRRNLRLATHQQNARNAGPPSHNTSGYKGVHFQSRLKSKPWEAYIRYDGKRHFLGYFASAIEAAEAYDQAARAHHGEFARLNIRRADSLPVDPSGAPAPEDEYSHPPAASEDTRTAEDRERDSLDDAVTFAARDTVPCPAPVLEVA